ncbi:hypothetical protein A5844_001924 [Enterococcus sp. 10A9_DIV0425]|uniref:Uncharacterized protein n=1 Tax=Candidatus Enterococcus wittei TaxID=1987383 RepID=A0A242JY33_9ENTE|nr:hypothetical protein [Enterococcus sp. 10A9_DIV0425]OTP10226.1 hypothetical protein A5844_001924 [Enterococcus sp. 10A9_DIV0425]THE14675.1 hypothetical protein E1H99_04305 [Enterococcus hirae]
MSRFFAWLRKVFTKKDIDEQKYRTQTNYQNKRRNAIKLRESKKKEVVYKIKQQQALSKRHQATTTNKQPIKYAQFETRPFKLMELDGNLSKSGPLLKRRLAAKQRATSHDDPAQQNTIKLEGSQYQTLEELMKLLTKWMNAEMEAENQQVLEKLDQAIAYGEKSINQALLNEANQEPFHHDCKEDRELVKQVNNLPNPDRKALEATFDQLTNIDSESLKGSLKLKISGSLSKLNKTNLNKAPSKNNAKRSSFSHELRA